MPRFSKNDQFLDCMWGQNSDVKISYNIFKGDNGAFYQAIFIVVRWVEMDPGYICIQFEFLQNILR